MNGIHGVKLQKRCEQMSKISSYHWQQLSQAKKYRKKTMPHTLRKSEKTDIFVDRLSKLTLWPATLPTATAASALIFTSVSKKSFIVTST